MSLVDKDLCIHVLGEGDSTRFVALIQPDEKVPHYRIRVEKEYQELTCISEEEVFPERVLSPNAQRIKRLEVIWLPEHSMRWLHAVLGKLIEHIETKEDV